MLVAENEVEKKEILRRYRRLLRKAKPMLKDGDAKIIKKAFNLSLDAHKDMRRKSGEPYIYHPLAVAEICIDEIGLGTTSIVSALLHDVVEDTDYELHDIERMFGQKVAKIIDGLTKISGSFEYGTSQQAENFRKMLLTLSEDVRVILIKIADRLHNMRTLDSMMREKQLKISAETIYLYAPLAHRLGLYSIKSELEDLYLKYNDSDSYWGITRKIALTKDVRSKFIRDFIKPIKAVLNKENIEFEIKGRPKSIHSIYNKMKKQNIPFEEVYDLFAVRIIIDVPEDKEKAACWHVYSLVTDFYKPNPDRLRDWISTSKANGYESLHTTVMSNTGQWVEVQIRSRRMDEIAEMGYAAHWKYKSGDSKKSAPALDGWLNRVRDLLEQNETSALEFLDDFRSNLFNEEVFVFTPQGDLKTLAAGATALDFAFEIHTQIGANCIGAKVNHKLVPLSYKLSNGDQVEILTSQKQKPSEDWLNFVVTSKAKAKIKSVLKEGKKEIIEIGRDLFFKKMKQLGIEPSPDIMVKMRSYFSLRGDKEIYYRFGNGNLELKDLKSFKKFLDKQKSSALKRFRDALGFKKEVKKIRNDNSDYLLIGEDMDKVDYVLAKCCNPIPGDDVFGFVTVNEGVKIHRTNCPNAVELMSNYGYRIVKAKWTSQMELAFLVSLRLHGTDRVGIVSDITKIISSDLQVNMRSITIDTEANYFDGQIKLYVNDTKHLSDLIQKLKKVKGIDSVTRMG
ncbi:bifunctional (p)ppGpp synthetase/guanosine-3',5'-bis(diphosphate) 3'-pyrophosphohydrolase [Hyphobacterium sp. CCMP332]|nr:bifunctional (p)ppGpp synthetase/guanosine-3',5'-bis(diphosphate) 3'-pyrophosphohydrolase [Hyphobacterium sp. CCMP332]